MMSRKKSRSGRQGKARDRSRHSDAKNAFQEQQERRRCPSEADDAMPRFKLRRAEQISEPVKSHPACQGMSIGVHACARHLSLARSCSLLAERNLVEAGNRSSSPRQQLVRLEIQEQQNEVCIEIGQGSKGGRGGGSGPHDAPAADPDGSKHGGCSPQSRIRSQTRRTLSDWGRDTVWSHAGSVLKPAAV